MLLLVLLGLHFALAAGVAAAGRAVGRGAFWLCAVAPGATLAWALTQAPALLDGQVVTATVPWVPAMDLVVDVRLDAFSLVMIGLVAGIGVLIFAYSFFYFDRPRGDLGRFAGLLLAFAGAMLGLVTADNLLAVFVFWELTSITSFLLIGFQHRQGATRAAALQALLITSGGGLALLGGIVLIAQAAGTYSLSGIIADPPSGGLVTAGVLCVVAGLFTKSAQVPFHGWLPGAMAAPTPVSAYLHSATMVKAGVYLTARLGPALAATLPVWRPLVMTVGVATMLLGGYRALRQHDLKLLLAFGTVSQLGFMMVLFGAGTEEAVFAGVALLLAHAAFKAALFMTVGVVDHATGTRDRRRLDGLGRRMPAVAAVAGLAAASMAGLPPLGGFIAKEEALGALAPGGGLEGGLALLWLAGVVAGSGLTVAYSWRFWHGAFGSKGMPTSNDPATADHVPAPGFWLPAGLLAVAAVVVGLVPAAGSALVESATVALFPGAEPKHLALWHGLGLPVALTVVAFAIGGVLIRGATGFERLQGRGPRLLPVSVAYTRALEGINRIADRTAAVTQSGSLPVYLGVILAAVVAAPTVAVLTAPLPWRPDYLADSWLQGVALVVAVASAIGVARATRRFEAVLALGGVGYATVTLFALHGAPDLALTQLLIETLTLIVFALALRHLPNRFHRVVWSASRVVRSLVAVVTGVFVTSFALISGAARQEAPISAGLITRSVPEAHGANVVNVILVDFRGIDTLGEITVLAVAGLGIAALVLAPGRLRALDRETADQQTEDAVAAGERLP